MVAFDAGSRAERREENGVAHFLEHLVFKGGERFPTGRDVNREADRLGARLNALTAPDQVAFHITSRAERAVEAADLLTDFVARPHIEPSELELERGVVLQEIARSHDQPAELADDLIFAAAFGDHALGRSTLGTETTLSSLDRDAVLAFRERRWGGQGGGVFLAGNLSGVSVEGTISELFGRFPAIEAPPACEPAPPPRPRVLVERRKSEQSHLRLAYRPHLDVSEPHTRAALTIYATLLGGTSGSRLFDEIRESRGLAYTVRASHDSLADAALVLLEAGLQSDRCLEAYRRMREIAVELQEQGPTEEEVERARSSAAGRRVLAFQRTAAVAEHAARQHVVFSDTIDPDEEISRLDGVSFDDVREVARSMGVEPAVACVGPHSTEEFG